MTETELLAKTLELLDEVMKPRGVDSDVCDCAECKRRDEPCHCDCPQGDECQGCYESRMDQDDQRFHADCASGRYSRRSGAW